ncbi:F-box protein [Monoraphidium neglectum]|uniref:F-box protein n=1 Tax=Monoraphidium neglectum TaxID=145388 RepID=A0A0D2M7A5_9CHLO|nr:F-box protein [Monoraphidium neglectum]KIY99244.1 F-box protein [Monoraphidium neglectum]|eukprot:XP_013898264.1 F-box protein [Monoraphidium neglectum]
MACPPHPYGIKPNGQAFLEACGDARGPGLGHMGALPDEVLLQLLYLLPASDLQRLGMASRALYAYCHFDELWKALLLERRYVAGSHRALAVRGLYSDLLYRPWLCATAELLPEWLEVENVDRRADLSLEEFRERYEAPNRPVIITDAAGRWPAVKKWTRQHLLQAFAGREVIVGNAAMRLAPYLAYADNNTDEMPLYMFDKAFALAAPQLARDYSVPSYFSDDLFELLGEEGRPDYRWLIIGPRRSGSSFHVDPNATSAWNAVITGAKKWILYPPGCTPPGVHVR